MHGRLGQPSSQSAPALGTPRHKSKWQRADPESSITCSVHFTCLVLIPASLVPRSGGVQVRLASRPIQSPPPVQYSSYKSMSIAAGVTMTGRSASRVSHQTPVPTLLAAAAASQPSHKRCESPPRDLQSPPSPSVFRCPPTKCHDAESAVVGDCAAFPLMRSVMRQPRFAFASPPGEKSSPHQTSSSGCPVPPSSDAPTRRAPMASRNRHDDTHTWPRAGGEQPRCVTKRVF